ncbi:MAG: hypothetical protein HQL61_18100 [Magnetococcales bacterium]|nr:hypothetical protein [Nitrospirota bacterium]
MDNLVVPANTITPYISALLQKLLGQTAPTVSSSLSIPSVSELVVVDIPEIPDLDIDYSVPDILTTVYDAILDTIVPIDVVPVAVPTIDPNVEQMVWDRARDKELGAAVNKQDEVMHKFAGLGYIMPTGAALAAYQAATTEANLNVATAGREFAIKQAELDFTAQMKGAEMNLDANKTNATLHLQADTKNNELKLEKVRLKIEGNIKAADVSISKGRLAIDAATQRAQLRAEWARLALQGGIERARMGVERARLTLEGRVKEAELTLQANSETARLQTQIQQAGISAAAGIEQAIIGYMGGYYERALQAQRALVDAGVQIFNSEVNHFNSKVGLFKTFADVYDTQLKGDLYNTEIYKAQMEGYKIEKEVQAVDVELYKAKLLANNTILEGYKIDMQAAELAANVQRLVLEQGKLVIDSHIATAQLKELEFRAWEAQVRGQHVQAQIYESQVNAYRAELEGARIQSAIEKDNLDAQIAQAKLNLDGYLAGLDMEKAKLHGDVSIEALKVDKYKAEIASWGEEARAIAEAFRVWIETERTNTEAKKAESSQHLEIARLTLQQMMNDNQLKLAAAKTGTDAFVTLLGHVLSSINTLGASIETISK